MQSLFVEMGPTTSKGGNQWFQFERDVCSLMQKLGFRIKHIAAGRNGDKGIDVLAVKGSDIDLVTWVIQCKCWNPKRKVMPATVRELAGVLSLRHAGTRGMIVTTSDFSSGAVEEAERHSIRLMAGEEFASRLIDSSE